MVAPSKPRVPPPPVLGGEQIDPPGPAGGSDTSQPQAEHDPKPGPPEEEETFGSLIDVLHAQLGRTPEVPAPIEASRRRGALPPPKAEATRASYNTGGASGGPPRAPGVHALPSGVRPPGAPDPLEPEDTGVLIASAVAALTAGDIEDPTDAAPSSAQGSLIEAPASPEVLAAPREPAVPPLAAAARTDAPPPPRSERNKAVWIGAVAFLGVGALWWLWPAPAEEAPEPVAQTVMAQRDEGPPADKAAAASPRPASSPQDPKPPATPSVALPAAVAETKLDVPDPAVAALESEAAAADTDAMADEEPRPDQADGSPPAPAQGESPDDPKPRAKKRRKNTKARAGAAPPTAAPAAEARPAKDGAALLADANAALTAGKHQSAYRLASKARGQGQRSGTLVVMAKAACRMGSEAKAKKAFGQMTLSERRGIRAECRTKGIRLGL